MSVLEAKVAHGDENYEFLNTIRYFEGFTLRAQKHELGMFAILPNRKVATIGPAFNR